MIEEFIKQPCTVMWAGLEEPTCKVTPSRGLMGQRRGLSAAPGENCRHGTEPQRGVVPVERQTEQHPTEVEEGGAVKFKRKHRQ